MDGHFFSYESNFYCISGIEFDAEEFVCLGEGGGLREYFFSFPLFIVFSPFLVGEVLGSNPARRAWWLVIARVGIISRVLVSFIFRSVPHQVGSLETAAVVFVPLALRSFSGSIKHS